MVLPAVDCATPPTPCCTALAEFARWLLRESFEGIEGCYDDTCEKPRAYITLGQDDGHVDTLTVRGTIGPMPGHRPGMPHPHRLIFTVRLLESGWPVAEEKGGKIVFPDPDAQNKLAAIVYGRGEALYRHLVAITLPRGLCVDTHRVAKASVSPLNMINPRGGTAGSEVIVTLDVAS